MGDRLPRLRPACLGNWRNNDFLQGRFRRYLCGKNDDLGYVSRVLQVLLLGHGNALLGKTIKEVGAHSTWDDGGDTDTINSPFHT